MNHKMEEKRHAGHVGQTPKGHGHCSLTKAHDTTCGTAMCPSGHVSGAAWGVKRLPPGSSRHTGTANESLQRPSSSIVVPSRAVRLSVVPLNVAMMSAAPVSVVHACGHDAERYGLA